MTEVQSGQIWRNVYGAHVVIGDLGVAYHDGQPHEVLWVQPVTDDGTPFGGPIPMNPPIPADEGGGFPGDLWTHVGEVAR